eukprot:CAMPEP_0172382970 /NCGR_PEP_ID=MMETSP1061-20121228/898_1 /TAXON_ID=37318 /ORGANISM="Pseudo-nitzschia pungens, Strain cf. pungens" /LENGTH=488 /DNA_ID=CAMNT_0013111051 /DNA_START=352 /DNA_END=1818 /DNA_ORIENTATION=-
MQFSRFAHGALSLVAVFLSASSVAGAGTCDSCEVYGTFKCGNDIYICPDVDHICSVQPSQNPVYHFITKEQCNQMQDVGLGKKCVALPQEGLTKPKSLSNRVCYPGGDGYHGMKEDGQCDTCQNSFATSTINSDYVTSSPSSTEKPEELLDLTSAPIISGTKAPEELLDLTSAPTSGTKAPEELQSKCSCGVNAANAGSFKCGNEVYVCPGQKDICNVQGSKNSVYYPITQEQCNQMRAVAIGTKCVPLPDHGITAPKDLSNRVCYDNEGPGVNGMKEDGSCGICESTIVPPFQTVPQTVSPTEDTATDAPEEDVSFRRTSSPTTAPPTGAPTASKKVCAGDIKVIKTHGVTGFPSTDDKHGVRILSQDTSTVTVGLDQQWVEDTIDHIFFSYKPSLFDNKCYQQQNVAGGATYKDPLTITCNVLTPLAYLEICVADTSVEGNATIPKCCQSQVAPETPKVCYHLEIKCVTGCSDETLSSRFLRGNQQ